MVVRIQDFGQGNPGFNARKNHVDSFKIKPLEQSGSVFLPEEGVFCAVRHGHVTSSVISPLCYKHTDVISWHVGHCPTFPFNNASSNVEKSIDGEKVF